MEARPRINRNSRELPALGKYGSICSRIALRRRHPGVTPHYLRRCKPRDQNSISYLRNTSPQEIVILAVIIFTLLNGRRATTDIQSHWRRKKEILGTNDQERNDAHVSSIPRSRAKLIARRTHGRYRNARARRGCMRRLIPSCRVYETTVT